MIRDKYLYIIGGPTASGKTARALELAQKLNTCIISADSRQFYKEMNIGTAKPKNDELQLVKHYFINNLSIKDEYNVGTYEHEVISLLDHLFIENDVVIMVGGSGLFIKSVTDGLDDFPEIEPEIRAEAKSLFESKGLAGLQELVCSNDPKFYSTVDINNPRRLMRAAEIILQTGCPFSNYRSASPKRRKFSVIKEYIDIDRTLLYNRINNRVLHMVDEGLKDEAFDLMSFRHLGPLQTVGYQEWFQYFEGSISVDRAIELVQQNTRRYAKRQVTWFKKDGGWSSHPPSIFF